ncbi:MAG: hypothetical protein GY754_31095 [bacterium]|nr:hypothetical protein [bacterium]
MKGIIKNISSFVLVCTLCLFSANLYAFWDNAHKNSAEDAISYMETEGSNQQRWVVDYLKAKTGGRDSGGTGLNPNNGDGTQYGLIGIARAGAVAPDYCQDLFWDDTTSWGWDVSIPGYGSTNFSSFTHFMNLLKTNDDGKTLKTNVYNDYDGWSYNGSFGCPGMGIDYAIASYMNNAWMTIDLANCSDCSGKYSFIPDGNPAVDYKQNGSTTVLGSAHSSKKVGSDDKTNYNCFSDCVTPNNCPDTGSKISGNSVPQIPNTGTESFWSGDWSKSNQDWVIFEPLDNAATFYYNEWFLEGGTSRSSSLDTGAVSGRYYSASSSDINYLTLVMHYAGDANTQHHIWVTSGYNHSDYEEWIDNAYGGRTLGGDNSGKNLEDYSTIKGYINSRSNQVDAGLDDIITENGFLTYLSRYRSGYDTLSNTDGTTRKNTATYAVNHAIATIVMLYEKGVLDLRENR